jgi:flagellar hook-associated protein 1 FlgK
VGSQLMTVGMRALAANYASLQVTGNNIANANVQGYSRQRVELASAQSRYTGGGFIGMGVDVKTVTRQYDTLRTREAMNAQSMAKMDEARLRGLTQLENAFPVGEEGLGHATSQFLNAMADVASRPTDISARQVVLARATDVATRFSDAARRIEEIQASVVEEVDAGVSRLNQLASGIADINDRLSRTQALAHSANDLLDERDRLLAQLNEVVQTTHYAADDGSLTVMIPGGHTLVLGNRANTLTRVADPSDPARVALASVQMGIRRPVFEGDLTGGALAGWLRLQNTDLLAARNDVGRLAHALASAVNTQQSLGLDLRGVNGAPIFSVGAPQVVSSAENRRTAGGAFASEVSIEVTDPAQLAATEYELRKLPGAPAGQWQLLRLSDGYARNVTDGAEADGFRLTLPSPEPSATDSFRIKPVAGAAAGMRRVVEDPRALAGASPVTAQAAVANTGTARVDTVRTTTPARDPSLSLQVVFTSDNGQYQIRDAAGAVVGPAVRQWQPGQAIGFEGQPGTVAGVAGTYDAFELSLTGVPRSGDTFAVLRTPYVSANNGNAQALLALRDATLVGRTVDAQGIVDTGKTFTDAYAAAVGQVGVTVQRARTAAGISDGMARAAETARASSSGVNLDEEAARLVQFQQSYQASAKVLQAAQTVFDSLLQVIG